MNAAQKLFSIKRQLVSAGFLSFALHGTGLAIRLGFMLMLLQLSGTALLGEYGLLVSIEVVTIYLAGFEFHSFTTRRYAGKLTSTSMQQALASHSRMLLISAPLATGAAALATWMIELELSSLELLLFLIIIFSGSIAQEANRFIILARSPVLAIATAFLRTAAWQPIALLFLADSNALTPILVCWSVAAVLSTIWAIWILRAGLNFRIKVRKRYLAQGVIASRGFYAVASATVLQGNLERFVLQSFLGPESVGLFTFFQTLANTLSTLVQSSVLNVALPNILSMFSKKQPDRFNYLKFYTRRSVIISIMISLFILFLSSFIYLFDSYKEYLDSIWILIFLLFSQIIVISMLPTQLAIYGAHHDRMLMHVSLFTLVVTFMLSIILIGSIGIEGAVVSQILGSVIASGARHKLFCNLRDAGHM